MMVQREMNTGPSLQEDNIPTVNTNIYKSNWKDQVQTIVAA